MVALNRKRPPCTRWWGAAKRICQGSQAKTGLWVVSSRIFEGFNSILETIGFALPFPNHTNIKNQGPFYYLWVINAMNEQYNSTPKKWKQACSPFDWRVPLYCIQCSPLVLANFVLMILLKLVPMRSSKHPGPPWPLHIFLRELPEGPTWAKHPGWWM